MGVLNYHIDSLMEVESVRTDQIAQKARKSDILPCVQL